MRVSLRFVALLPGTAQPGNMNMSKQSLIEAAFFGAMEKETAEERAAFLEAQINPHVYCAASLFTASRALRACRTCSLEANCAEKICRMIPA